MPLRFTSNLVTDQPTDHYRMAANRHHMQACAERLRRSEHMERGQSDKIDA